MPKEKKLNLFEKYLTLWVLLCMAAGILLGKLAPGLAITLDAMSLYQVSIPIAICLFFMMYPIMVKIDFAEVVKAAKTPKPVAMTLFLNWAIKPFTMYLFAYLFLGVLFRKFLPGTEILKDGQEVELWRSYISGAILLGIAPCTAMVLMWSYLAKGNDGLTLVMVAINSLTMLVLYAPLGSFLLGVNAMPIPWRTLLFSVGIYVALPLVAGYFSRKWIIARKGTQWFQEKFIHYLTPVSIGALLLTVEPGEVDVNVHPAKTEVRLSREREIHDALYRLVKESLRQQGVIPQLQVPSAAPRTPASPIATVPDSRSPVDDQNIIPGITRPMPTSAGQMKEIFERTPPVSVPDTPSIVQVDTSTGEIVGESQPGEPTGAPASLQFIGRFDNLYLLFQSGNDLLMVDQHTAHERVLFEEMLRQMGNEGGLAQHLLLPVQVDLGADQMALFDDALATLNRSGFNVAPFGAYTVRIEATPAVLTNKSPEKSFLAVLDDIASLKKSGYDLNKAVAQSIACRSAVMAGDRLSDQEAISLVDSLLKCENRYSCPHGRPTFIKMSRKDLDKQFGRG